MGAAGWAEEQRPTRPTGLGMRTTSCGGRRGELGLCHSWVLALQCCPWISMEAVWLDFVGKEGHPLSAEVYVLSLGLRVSPGLCP